MIHVLPFHHLTRILMSAGHNISGPFLQMTQSLLHVIGVCVTDKKSQGMIAHILTKFETTRQVLRQVGLSCTSCGKVPSSMAVSYDRCGDMGNSCNIDCAINSPHSCRTHQPNSSAVRITPQATLEGTRLKSIIEYRTMDWVVGSQLWTPLQRSDAQTPVQV
jgi:hypothetical protein